MLSLPMNQQIAAMNNELLITLYFFKKNSPTADHERVNKIAAFNILRNCYILMHLKSNCSLQMAKSWRHREETGYENNLINNLIMSDITKYMEKSSRQ
jgi:hypothetical protein